ncbi:septum formation family protein [Kitasatospora sp. NPDC051914]|uniref:septum formation family protein n=1 Tax=Kitasatospora sp. NPDC051914 TaxID=3154945 RepID=UPI0034295423
MTCGDVRTVSGYDLRAGDCFGRTPSEARLLPEVLAVPCGQAHHGEVVGLADLGDAVAGNRADRAKKAEADCSALLRGYPAAGQDLPVTAGIDFLLPRGNSVVVRTQTKVVCAVVDDGPGWTRSLHETGAAAESAG